MSSASCNGLLVPISPDKLQEKLHRDTSSTDARPNLDFSVLLDWLDRKVNETILFGERGGNNRVSASLFIEGSAKILVCPTKFVILVLQVACGNGPDG